MQSNTVRELPARVVEDAVCDLFARANVSLPADMEGALTAAAEKERSPLARRVLARLVDNVQCARTADLPICQDTGMAVVFCEVGADLHITGATLEEAIHAGVHRAYLDGALRCSVVEDPLFDRRNTTDNTPAVIHTRIVRGDRLRIQAAPKGFGSENMSRLKMFTPAATEEDILRYVVDCVREGGANPCPPVVVGVGIGGNFEQVALLAKRALLAPLQPHPDARYAALEAKMLAAVNELGIGPQGFGGDTTALAVKIETAPTHIAGLPVAVNMCCHVLRHAEITL